MLLLSEIAELLLLSGPGDVAQQRCIGEEIHPGRCGRGRSRHRQTRELPTQSPRNEVNAMGVAVAHWQSFSPDVRSLAWASATEELDGS